MTDDTVSDVVRASVEVAVDPAEAFRVFTEEIDSWYRVDRYTVLDYRRTKEIAFEPWVGGRFLDVHDEHTREGVEMGRITAWEPGRRLSFVDMKGTEIEVTFASADTGTTVTIEHRGLARLAPADPARRYGWRVLLPWYASAFEEKR
ncbi:activator of Hsp90 ATPase-like protein [Herbihabitans rhizosphaerae]|uniref:Activator of Hsp90 ATPase-like protein n=1 Tax=Herbihabitans rhizosphaerae TaxID=1872711 RepID=A0A4Q7KSY8_9PSEU|nr:SRPBCC domain-containing protein [Herbihabitans rhizosphaerae]RZS38901.1 activator of Hsp90 ATPase-like protein [Herbihabitans rhizosphaerae]